MVYITNWSLKWCLWNTETQYYDLLNGKRQIPVKIPHLPNQQNVRAISGCLERPLSMSVSQDTSPLRKKCGANMCGSLNTVFPASRVTRTHAHQALCLRNPLSSALWPHYFLITIFIYLFLATPSNISPGKTLHSRADQLQLKHIHILVLPSLLLCWQKWKHLGFQKSNRI